MKICLSAFNTTNRLNFKSKFCYFHQHATSDEAVGNISDWTFTIGFRCDRLIVLGSFDALRVFSAFFAVDLIQLVIKFLKRFYLYFHNTHRCTVTEYRLRSSPRCRSHESMKMHRVTWRLLWQVFAYGFFFSPFDRHFHIIFLLLLSFASLKSSCILFTSIPFYECVCFVLHIAKQFSESSSWIFHKLTSLIWLFHSKNDLSVY